MTINIALVQFWVELNKNFQYTSRKVEKYIQMAARKNCSIICFPEDFWFGPFDYYSFQEIKNIVSVQTPKIITWFQQKAREYKIHIIAGTFIEKVGNNFFNIATTINRKGGIVYKYKKQNLVPYGFEKEYASRGNDNHVINFDGIKIGIIICRDLFYPELMKNLRMQGAEIVFVPSFWTKRSSDYTKQKLANKYNFLTEHKIVGALCQSRSFENKVAILYVNASGNLKNKTEFDVLLGRTQTCIPFYGCTNKLNQNKEGLLIFEYDKSIILDARRVYQL